MTLLSTLKNLPNDKLNLFLILGSSTVVGYFVYVTLKIGLNHRKYNHIPRPPNEG
jgi:hypothetical protein